MNTIKCASVIVALIQALAGAPLASARLRKPPQGQSKKSLHRNIPLPLPEKLTSSLGKNEPDDSNNRIVGGEPVSSPGVYPFFVSWDGSCGGSLIHSDIVLTAAHCNAIPSNSVTVDAFKLDDSSTEGAVSSTIVERSTHPEYNSFTLSNDFLLLKLDSPVASIQPIKLNDESTVPSAGQNLTVIGLGTTTEGGFQADTLQQVTVQTVSDQECNDQYDGEIVDDVMFCAGIEGGGKDSCQGDSGGPIFTVTGSGEVEQVGVVSWGYGCAQPEFPGVYAEISAVKEWILNEICRLSEDKPIDCPEPTPPPTPSPPGEDEAVVTVDVQTDLYPQEVSWTLFDDTGTVVGSVEEGTYYIQEQLFTERFNLKLGNQYTFTIEDSAGDGLCCSYGEGMWSVRAGDVVLASGASYGASDSATFVVPEADPAQSTPSPTPAGSEATQAPTPFPTSAGSDPVATQPPTPSPTIPSEPRDCDDTTDTVYVDSVAGNQSCDWLSTNLDRYGYLCQFVDVAAACPATCDWCSVFG